MDEVQAIQFAFPAQPDWGAVGEETLLALVRDYVSEPSCAMFALGELARRKYADINRLCEFLLDEPGAGQLLHTSALSILLSRSPLNGFDRAHALVDGCDAKMLSEIIMALNYEHEGPLAQLVLVHPVVPKMKARLQHFQAGEVDFADLFYQRFGE